MATQAPNNRIFVVDDDASFAQLVSTWLSRLGLTCETFPTGEEALKRIAAEVPRAVILDGLLPGIRGDELARRVRQTHDAEALPILFVSAFFRDLRSYSRLTKECGVNAVIHKPVTEEDLVPAVRKILGLKAPDPAEQIEIHVEPLEEELSEEIDDLLPEYLGTCRERVAAMRTSLMALGGPAEAEAREVLQIESHRLRGSGASFGLPEITRVARQIEDLLRDRDASPLSLGERSRLAGLVEGLSAVVAKAAGDRVITTERAHRLARVWLLDAPATELAAACKSPLNSAPVEVFHDVVEALATLERTPPPEADGTALALALADRPDAVFVAADRLELDAPAAAARLLAAGIGPLLFVTRDASVSSRQAAIAAGAAGIVPRLADGPSLLRIAREFDPETQGFTALAIACPPKPLEALAQPLAIRGIALQPCPDIERAVESIDAQGPAVLIVGGASELEGPELIRALRTDPAVLSLPLVAFAGTLAQADRMIEAGAEDWFGPAMPVEAIARRLTMHARRRLRHARDLTRDALTGAARRPAFLEELDRGIALARRSGRSLGVLLVAFDAAALAAARGRFALLEVASGLTAQLRASFRSSDVLARLDEGRFAVLLQEASGDDGRRLLGRLLATLAGLQFGPEEGRFEVAFQGGWAGFPEVTGGSQALLDAAEASLLG